MPTERSLDEIMEERDAPEGGAPPPQGEDRSPPVEQPRDQRGRWASKGDNEDDDGEAPQQRPPQPQPGQPAPQERGAQPPDGYVPIQALDARLAKSDERLAAVLAQNAQLMQALAGNVPKPPPAQAPDFFDNPDAAFEHRIAQAMTPVQQQLQAQTERFSSMMAVEKFGLEPVKEAYGALAQRVQQLGPQDPTYLRIMRSEHPYGELVRWHQEQSALNAYGSDPAAYIKAEVDRQVREALQGQPTPRGPAPRMPAQLSGSAPNVGQRTQPGYAGPRPLSEIMGR